MKNIIDNKKFWKTIKPFAINKFSNSAKISLLENEKVVSDDSEIANNSSNFYKNIVTSLNLKCDVSFISDTSHLVDPVNIAIEKFKNHPSISLIKNNDWQDSLFEFTRIEKEDLTIKNS